MFRNPAALFKGIVANLVPLPKTLRYYDHSEVRHYDLVELCSDRWELFFDRRIVELDFSHFATESRDLIKAWCAFLLARRSPVTAEYHFRYMQCEVSPDVIRTVVTRGPEGIRAAWNGFRAESMSHRALLAVQSFLQYLCACRVGPWRPEWKGLISELPLPEGDVLLVDEQAKLVEKIEEVTEIVANLVPLPETLRYCDDFDDKYVDFDELHSDYWTLFFDRRIVELDFSHFATESRDLIKAWCAFLLARRSPVTAENYFGNMRREVSPDVIRTVVTCGPEGIRAAWNGFRAGSLSYGALLAVQSFLQYLCACRIGPWRPEWKGVISKLGFPKVDKYKSIRMGDVFLSADEQSKLVENIDEVTQLILSTPDLVSDSVLTATAALVCSYQFLMRPKQICMVRIGDVRVWHDGLATSPAVHINFKMIKQHSLKQVLAMVRSVKREWSALFVELCARAAKKGRGGRDQLFPCKPGELGTLISNRTRQLLERRRGANALRHTGAQRLADAGATEEEIASSLGHRDLDTGLRYIKRSGSQAQLLNQALGLSAVAKRVLQIAHDRFIDPTELAKLKADQQIGGVPHGIPIVGIGGCSSGQPACPYNPVMSCYGCRKFMPVRDTSLHEKVLAEFRGIVKFFFEASRGESSSPAYLQLQDTINDVQRVIEELKNDGD